MLSIYILANANETLVNNIAAPVISVVTVVGIVLLRRRATSRRSAKTKVTGAKVTPFVYPTHPVIEGPSVNTAPSAWPIDSIRQLMGPVPRTFDPALASYLRILPPKWLEANVNDEQWLNINHQERIRREGAVVWGTIVQANNNLFKPINAETGASVIYSPDPWFDRNRNALGQIAAKCFALKGTDPADPESAAFARMLTNELTRGMRMKVPGIFTGGRNVFHSSMLMPRKQLPKGYLTGRYFPLWIDAQKTGAVAMVPAAYWPASLTMEWDNDADPQPLPKPR